MRILHVYGGNLYGGVERLLVSFSQFGALAPGLEQEFGLCYSGRLWRELEVSGAKIHNLGGVRLSRWREVTGARARLRCWLATERYAAAVCHSWWSYGIFGPALRQAGVPVAVWIHDDPWRRGWLERWGLRQRPELVLTYSAYLAGRATSLWQGRTPVCVGAPVEARPLTAERTTIRRELNTPEDSVVVLQVSRLEKWKGQLLLLQALKRLAQDEQWTAWIAGGAQRRSEERYRAELEAAANTLGISHRIRWLGERNDVAALMGAADLFCQPNLAAEPYGIVFLEALASGLPVVATAMGGVEDTVRPECGRLVPAQPAAVARGLAELIGNRGLRAEMGAAARARAMAVANPETCMQALERALAGVAR